MKRRQFISLLGGIGITGWPGCASAQQPSRLRRIGWMDSFREDDPNARARVKAFLEVIGKLGWTVGGNLEIDYRWDLFDVGRARQAGVDLLNLSPDLVFCGGTPSPLAKQQAARAPPIAF